jgi:hypothetical protein
MLLILLISPLHMKDTSVTNPVEIFFSYSHKDEKLRKELENHLANLQRQGVITNWHDRKIGAGREWKGVIDKHLKTAKIILLLVSPYFMASDYCNDVEIKLAMQRHETGETVVIPIILRPVDWKGAAFEKLQALPKDAIPVTLWRNRDEAFNNIVQGIRKVVDGFSSNRIAPLYPSRINAYNPFVWRAGITSSKDFFNRENEQITLRDFLYKRQHYQIVGPRRIGKTSLLLQVERVATLWDKTSVVAYIDLQDARCSTVAGLLHHISKRWGWMPAASTLAEFAQNTEDMVSKGRHPVLCLDEFEELTLQRTEFDHRFFSSLRACAQLGLSIITASQKTLSELTDPSDSTSSFYNIFPILRLGPFSNVDAEDFVNILRMDITPFEPDEKNAILQFANGHPLALQIACFHVLQTKARGLNLVAAMRAADDDLKAHLPNH